MVVGIRLFLVCIIHVHGYKGIKTVKENSVFERIWIVGEK